MTCLDRNKSFEVEGLNSKFRILRHVSSSQHVVNMFNGKVICGKGTLTVGEVPS